VVTAVTVVIVVVAADDVVIVATETVLADVDELASDVDEAGAADELFITDFAAPPQALRVRRITKTIRRVVIGGNHTLVISGVGVRHPNCQKFRSRCAVAALDFVTCQLTLRVVAAG
jgi:hypothetical protein